MIQIYDITPRIWESITRISKEFNVDPFLIAAIGQHETGWGALVDHNLYTGFGAFDGGFTDRWAGLDGQIRGTARKLSAWGMTQDKTSLEKLQAANRGDLYDGEHSITGIYATDRGWADKVWRWRNRIIEQTQTIKPGLNDKLQGRTLWKYIEDMREGWAENEIPEEERIRRMEEAAREEFARIGRQDPLGEITRGLEAIGIKDDESAAMPLWARILIILSGIIMIIILVARLVVSPTQSISKIIQSDPIISTVGKVIQGGKKQ